MTKPVIREHMILQPRPKASRRALFVRVMAAQSEVCTSTPDNTDDDNSNCTDGKSGRHHEKRIPRAVTCHFPTCPNSAAKVGPLGLGLLEGQLEALAGQLNGKRCGAIVQSGLLEPQ